MKTSKLKIAAVALTMLFAGAANAQTDAANAGTDATLEKGAGDGESVKLVDNKGTIKYLQSNNGITTITSTAGGSRTTTTWQLGGTLSTDTYIDATGAVFALDGIAKVTAAELAVIAAGGADIADRSTAKAGSANINATAAGFAFLVRDELTGETKKLAVGDLLASGQDEHTMTVDAAAAFTLPGTLPFPVNIDRVQVYRNGAKLRGGVDYVLTATFDGIVLQPVAGATAQSWELYTDDIIEYYYAK